MSECCLITDTVQFFKDRGIPFNAQNLIADVSAYFSSCLLGFRREVVPTLTPIRTAAGTKSHWRNPYFG